MATDLVVQGFQLMVVGMGTVFLFLTILVLATQLMSYLIGRTQDVAVAGVSAEEIAAMTAAIDQHRRKRR